MMVLRLHSKGTPVMCIPLHAPPSLDLVPSQPSMSPRWWLGRRLGTNWVMSTRICSLHYWFVLFQDFLSCDMISSILIYMWTIYLNKQYYPIWTLWAPLHIVQTIGTHVSCIRLYSICCKTIDMWHTSLHHTEDASWEARCVCRWIFYGMRNAMSLLNQVVEESIPGLPVC